MTVSQLNALVKRVLGNELPMTIHLLGQISNLSRAGSGHVYFTLKDDKSEIRAVMWRSSAAAVKFKITNGMEVVATGSVDVYEPRGQYTFQVRRLEPKGVGSLELAFRQLHEKLGREGLFEKARKKAIPRYPRRVGVITSRSGAAFQDIIQTVRRRFPCLEVLLYPVRVQGEGADLQIAEALRILNDQAATLGGIDVLIVARGGGSLEDLWAFNEEVVARAIHASRIPVVSGVGHEVDVTIADLVADLRAPTPTAAAELAVPLLSEVLESLDNSQARLSRCARHQLEIGRSRLESVQRAEFFRSPLSLVHRREQRVDECAGSLRHGLRQFLSRAHRRVHELELRLARVRPSAILHLQQIQLAGLDHKLQRAAQRRLLQAERLVNGTARALLNASPSRRLAAEREKLHQYKARIGRGTAYCLGRFGSAVEMLAGRLEATSYRRTLCRGYTVTCNEERDRNIRRSDEVSRGQVVVTQTADGEFRSRVEG